MAKKDRILLIDFSKVVSPIWISRHLSDCLSDFLTLPKEEIRAMYKRHIWELVKWGYSITIFLEELIPYLKTWYSKSDLFDASKQIPTLDMDFLEWIKELKNTYYIYLVSDIHEVLWEEVRKQLGEYFDDFIFSYEEKAKKSSIPHFWASTTPLCGDEKIKKTAKNRRFVIEKERKPFFYFFNNGIKIFSEIIIIQMFLELHNEIINIYYVD